MSDQTPTPERSEHLTQMIEQVLGLLAEYVNKYKETSSIDSILKQDLRYFQTQVDNTVLEWIIQQSYIKLRSEELRLATEINAMQHQDAIARQAEEEAAAAKKAAEVAKPVEKTWSIEDEE
jgi:hypothetical protein